VIEGHSCLLEKFVTVRYPQDAVTFADDVLNEPAHCGKGLARPGGHDEQPPEGAFTPRFP